MEKKKDQEEQKQEKPATKQVETIQIFKTHRHFSDIKNDDIHREFSDLD